MHSLDNISFQPLDAESLSPKENSMQLRVMKLCRGGRWYQYRAVPLRQGRRSKGISTGYRATKRSSYSSTAMILAVRQRRKRAAYSHLARSRSHTLRVISKMRAKPSLPVTLKRFVELYGTRGHTVQMGSLKLDLSLN